MGSNYSSLVRVAHTLLKAPICYNLLQISVGAEGFRNRFLKSLLEEDNSFSHFMDMGCGPGVNRKIIGDQFDYVGVDLSDSYIKKAKSKFESYSTTTFVQGDLTKNLEPYSLLNSADSTMGLAFALWHHLNDEQVGSVLRNIHEATSGNLTISSIDPIITEDSSRFAVWLAHNDRGPYLRTEEEFEKLYSNNGFSVNMEIYRNQMRIPGNIIAITATKK